MSQEETRARVRRLARGMRYKELPSLVGKSVVVKNLQTLESDLHDSLGAGLPAGASLKLQEPKFLLGVLVKYSILDLKYLVPQQLVTGLPSAGLEVLKSLGFVLTKSQIEEFNLGTDDLFLEDPTCLEMLEEDLQPDAGLLLVFLESERLFPLDSEGSFERFESTMKNVLSTGSLPDSYLPREFKVLDACLTNNPMAWFHKHFYM